MTTRNLAIATTLALTVALAPLTASFAQKKENNKLLPKAGRDIGHAVSKLGHNTEYGVRKGGENASVETHRALGKKSVVKKRGKNYNEVVKPNGQHVKVKKQ